MAGYSPNPAIESYALALIFINPQPFIDVGSNIIDCITGGSLSVVNPLTLRIEGNEIFVTFEA